MVIFVKSTIISKETRSFVISFKSSNASWEQGRQIDRPEMISPSGEKKNKEHLCKVGCDRCDKVPSSPASEIRWYRAVTDSRD